MGDFIKAMRTSTNTWNSYLNGATFPDSNFLTLLKQLSGVPLDWIITGDMPTAQPGEEALELDLDVLERVMGDVMLMVEHAWNNGMTHPPANIAAMIRRMYVDRIKKLVDEKNSMPHRKDAAG